jgi:transcription elongation factor Elf1
VLFPVSTDSVALLDRIQVVTKKRPKLAKRFKCPFCANDDTVECKMDFKLGIGSLNCRLCGASYQMPIHHLNEPIDVFSEWLDDCEAAATGGSARAHGDENDDDALPTASGLGARKVAPKNDANARSIDLGVGDSEDEDDDE